MRRVRFCRARARAAAASVAAASAWTNGLLRRSDISGLVSVPLVGIFVNDNINLYLSFCKNIT